MVAYRPAKLLTALALGPLTAPLALAALDHARRGDWPGAIAYGATVPCVWLHLAVLAGSPWIR